MDDYAIVLNAGSSSLKFSVYRRPARGRLGLEARGQIDGIGTSPRFSASDGAGATARRRARWRQRCATGAPRSTPGGMAPLALRRRAACWASAIASSTAAPGTPARRSSRRRSWRSSRRWSRSRPSISRTTWPQSMPSPSGCPACRRSRASTPASIAASRRSRRSCRCRARSVGGGVQRYGFHGLSYEYIASVLPEVAPEIAQRPRDRRASGQRREPLRDEGRQERGQHARVHGARRALHGHAARRASIPA